MCTMTLLGVISISAISVSLPDQRAPLLQQLAPTMQTHWSTQHRAETKARVPAKVEVLPAGDLPAAIVSESVVDETPECLVLVRLAALEVEREPDPGGENDEVDRPEPAREAQAAADEVDVLEEQEQHHRLSGKGDDGCQHCAPPVDFAAVVLPEVTEDRDRDQCLHS